MTVDVTFATGAIGLRHPHPREQLTYEVSGRFAFTIHGETREVGAGERLREAPVIQPLERPI